MKELWIVTLATARMLIRNKQTLFFALFVPLALMLVIGFLTKDNSVDVNVGVVYNQENPSAQAVVEQLKSIDSLKITNGTLDEEKKQLEDNKRDLVIVLPDDFSLSKDFQGQNQQAQHQAQREPVKIQVFENIEKPSQTYIAQTVISQIFNKLAETPGTKPAFIFEKQEVAGKANVRYIDFLVPGIISMTIMQLGIFGTAFAVVDAKQKGVLKRVMATPVRPWQYIGGNLISRLLMSIVQSAIIVAVAYFAFDIHFYHWGSLLLLVILGNIVFLSIGLFISGVASTIDSVPIIANLITFPMLLLGNVFFPTDSLPAWIKLVVEQLPIAVLADLIRQTVTLGKKFSEVGVELLILVAWAIAMIVLANSFFKLQEKE